MWRLYGGTTVLCCDAKILIESSLKSAFVYVQSFPEEWGLRPWFGAPAPLAKRERNIVFSVTRGT